MLLPLIPRDEVSEGDGKAALGRWLEGVDGLGNAALGPSRHGREAGSGLEVASPTADERNEDCPPDDDP